MSTSGLQCPLKRQDGYWLCVTKTIVIVKEQTDVMCCYVASVHAWTDLVCDGWINILLDNGGVLVTRVSLCLLTRISVLGELNIWYWERIDAVAVSFMLQMDKIFKETLTSYMIINSMSVNSIINRYMLLWCWVPRSFSRVDTFDSNLVSSFHWREEIGEINNFPRWEMFNSAVTPLRKH